MHDGFCLCLIKMFCRRCSLPLGPKIHSEKRQLDWRVRDEMHYLASLARVDEIKDFLYGARKIGDKNFVLNFHRRITTDVLKERVSKILRNEHAVYKVIDVSGEEFCGPAEAVIYAWEVSTKGSGKIYITIMEDCDFDKISLSVCNELITWD